MCVVGHLLGLVQDGVEGASLEWPRGRGQVGELAKEAFDGAGLAVVLFCGGQGKRIS